MNTIQTFKFGLRYREVKSCFLAAAEQEVAVPGSLLVNGWTVVEDRIVPGIFPPGLLTDTALAERRPGPGLWFSALPRIRRHGQYSRNMLGFTLGLASCEVSSARLQSRLWVVDRRGRVRYCDSQDRERGGERLEYCWLSHSLPHDIRLDSWLVLSVMVSLGDKSRVSALERDARLLTTADFLDAEDPVIQMKLVTDWSKSILRDEQQTFSLN